MTTDLPRYDAITVDTCIFIKYGIELENGLLKQLEQFKESSFNFVLSEVIQGELIKHLQPKAKAAKNKLSKSINENFPKLAKTDQDIKNAIELVIPADEPKKLAEIRLNRFLTESGCQIVKYDRNSLETLMGMYFDTVTPFGKGEKSYEFPDAIALMSLVEWAEKNGKRILAVSEDGGWKDFAKTSNWIDVEADLSTAMDKLNSQLERRNSDRNIIEQTLLDLDYGTDQDKNELYLCILNRIENSIYQLNYYPEANSYFGLDYDDFFLTPEEFQFIESPSGENKLQLISEDKGEFTFSTNILVSGTAYATFDFSVRDSVDKDYVPMGASEESAEFEIELKILITLQYTEEDDSIELLDLELIKNSPYEPLYIDFGDISPDFGIDDYD